MDFYRVPLWQRQAIKEGADFITAEGETVPNSRLTTDADPALSYAYCSDTVFDPALLKLSEESIFSIMNPPTIPRLRQRHVSADIRRPLRRERLRPWPVSIL